VIDSPGFVGDFEEGYARALHALDPRVDEDARGVNIDGLNPVDPFYRGNWLEAKRLLVLAGAPVGIGIAKGRLADLRRAGPLTVETNPALASGVGRSAGTLLGLRETDQAFQILASSMADLDTDAIAAEVSKATERIDYACDKFLRRLDPPRVAIFASHAYAAFAAEQLKRHLDAEIACIGPRSRTPGSAVPAVRDLETVRGMLDAAAPDLVLGSAYEQSIMPDAAFVHLTPPVRDRVQLQARMLVGTEGALSFMEDVLNACRDHAGRDKKK
jgi:nitrogenase molybdenum-iron protein alpha/beta subunit